jgi:hypothetical protein
MREGDNDLLLSVIFRHYICFLGIDLQGMYLVEVN